MLFVSSQPDNTFFIWQLLTLYENMKEQGIPKEDIHCLIGYVDTLNPEWSRWADKIHATMHFIPDDRISRTYSVSIRPNIIKKFIQDCPRSDEYIFYHDSDIYFTDIPLLEGMEDGRIHVSRTDYLDWWYIRSKNSPTLMSDLLNVVGIDEETIKLNQPNTGGAQVYAKGLTYDYWDKVERDCEAMYIQYWKNWESYKFEYEKTMTPEEILANPFDFQYWTVEMWCMLWNQWLFGFKTYANPDLKFSWPNWNESCWDECAIFHNSGLIKTPVMLNETIEQVQIRERNNNNWFFKGDYNNSYPEKFDFPCLIYFDNNQTAPSCQIQYIKAIERTAKKYWLHPLYSYWIIVTTPEELSSLINKFEEVTDNRKELIILNTNINNIVRSDRYTVINTNVHFATGQSYQSMNEIMEDITKFAKGELIDLKNA